MSEIKVVPCPANIQKKFHVEMNGKEIPLTETGRVCGTEAEALEKAAKLRSEDELLAHGDVWPDMTERIAAALPVETRPPAPREKVLIVGSEQDVAYLKRQIVKAIANENSDLVEQAAPPRPLWQVSELPTGLQPDRKAMGKIPVGHWFLYDSPSCTQRYSIQERTESGCSIVCSSPYTHEGVKRDFLKIMSLYNAELATPAAIEQARPQTPELRDPTPEELDSPRFNAVWKAIKGWDIRRTPREGYAGATGTDVCTILDALAAAEPAPERTPQQQCESHAPLVKKAQEFYEKNLAQVEVDSRYSCSRFHNMAAFARWFGNLDHDHQQRIIHPEHPEWRESKVPSAALVAYRADIDKHTAAKDFDSLWTTAESLLAALESTARAVAVPVPARSNPDIVRLLTGLHEIHDLAHSASSGPETGDTYWAIRNLADRLLTEKFAEPAAQSK